MDVFCDFDGTIAQVDVTDLVLERFADPAWRDVEADWTRGKIDSATCMAQQVALLRAPLAEINACLDEVEIDPGFPDFVAWARANHVPLKVVSDGIDHCIERVLGRHGFGDIPVFANRLSVTPDGYSLSHPWRGDACRVGSGVCKCAVNGAGGDTIVFVGDGRSDRCAAPAADILFAKSGLADYCRRLGTPFIAYDTFHDVHAELARRHAHASRPVPAGPAAA